MLRILVLACVVHCSDVRAQAAGEDFAVHAQFTYVEQNTSDFNAPYQGANSLSPNKGAETTDATLYLGARPWSGAQLWLNGEFDQGFGLDNTLGAAGFPSGEAYKVGKKQPYFRLQRLFLRQNFDLAGERTSDAAGANQLAADHDVNRVLVTVGKFGVVDVFDTNRYASNPRSDFLNWTAINTGSFDYAADAWGYTVGAAVEWYQGPWTWRLGAFDLSTVPNSVHLDPGFHEFQLVTEFEHRHTLGARKGKALLTLFDSRGRMGLLRDAVAAAQATGAPPDIAAVRGYRGRAGGSMNFEQELTADLGLFARAGKAAGNVESYEFTDVDRSLCLGLALQGSRWKRSDDTLGLAFVANNASRERLQYFNAGGLGILVGDGRLPHAGPEQIVESYYSLRLLDRLQLSFDFQRIAHLAYNRDRGPASIFAFRLHAQF